MSNDDKARVTVLPPGSDYVAHLRSLDDAQLLAQDITQQGAIHAISTLLVNGGGRNLALDMLNSLRLHATQIREEARRRGKPSMFDRDQTPGSQH